MPADIRSTVVVVTWRGRAHITACLDALQVQTRPHRLLVVDNASDDGTAALLKAHPSGPRVLRTRRNLGYAGALHQVLPLVETEFVAWCNDDSQPETGWLAELEKALDADSAAAAVSARLLSPAGRVQTVGVGLTGGGYGHDLTSSVTGEVFGFCGGSALLRTAALRAVGGVPAGFFCYYEDTDTAWRLRLAGWRVRSAPLATAVHLHGASTEPGSARFHRWNERNRLLMVLRCAPGFAAILEPLRFLAITALLPVRRALGRQVPDTPNFRPGLRLRVLAGVLIRLPGTLRARTRISALATVRRTTVWAQWVGKNT
ncbi:glycosyltransferase family 2 protein [Pseudonocardiaceae bacterium YIM PH 21723]|nr:glycosyltransferase family 2 protein [Pseudonocardiaceae bacterium YIM PH 21723]